MRICWTIAQINGRHASVILDNIIVDSILLKAPQIFWLCSFIYTSLVWKRLTDQSQTMTSNTRSSNKSSYKKLSFKVTLLNVLLLGVLLPAYIIGTIWYPLVSALVDYFFFLLCTAVAIQGYRFGTQLCVQLKRTSMGAFLAPTIMWSIYYASFAVLVVILYGVTYKGFLSNNHPELGLLYAFIVHQLCETLTVYSLLLTKKNSEKEKERRLTEQRSRTGTKSGIGGRSRATTGGTNADNALRNINDSYASTIETVSPSVEKRVVSVKKEKKVVGGSGKSISFKDAIAEDEEEKNMV